MAPKRRKRGRRKPPARDWTVDERGRWRNPRGQFASRAAVLDRLTVGTPEDTGRALQQAGTRVKRTKAKGDYSVQVYFEGVGWRSASYATGLDAALMQAGDWLENQLGQQVGFYGRDPTVVDVSIRRVKSGESTSLRGRKRKAPARTKKGRKR